jgi:hypothetical protein
VQVATVGGGVPAGTNVGELWVSYDVELTGPRLPDRRSGYLRVYATDYTNTNILGSSPKLVQYGIFSGAKTSGTNNTVIELRNSSVGDIIEVVSTWEGGVAVAGAVTIVGTGLTASAFLTGSDSSRVSGGTSSTLIDIRYFLVDKPSATITFSSATLPTTPTGVDIVINTVAYGVTSSAL